VEGRDLGALLDGREDPLVHERRVDLEVAEVDDPVPDGVRRHKVVHSLRRAVFGDDGELEARRARVDDEDPTQS
jgi:hypothetical protein